MARTRRAFLAGAGAAGAALYLGSREVAHAPPGAPNVLLVVIDTLRVDHVYGPRAHTPNMDALRREGLSITGAIPEAMPTVPARNSILSGRRMFPFRDWEYQLGLLNKPGWEPVHDTAEIFTSRLRRAGWWTGYVTDNPFLGFSRPYDPFRQSFHRFDRFGGQVGGIDRPVAPERLDPWLHPAVLRAGKRERVRLYIANRDYADDESKSFAATVFTSGIDALEAASRKRPFFLAVDTFEPHEPWTPPKRYRRMYGDPDYDGPEPATVDYGRVENWILPEEEELVLSRLRALYAAELTMTDRWLGFLIEKLHDLGLERDTIVVLVGDHGVQLGERGWTGKISIALHPELVRVPLVIVDPERRRAGESSGYRASTHDVAPTILSMAGVRTPDYMDGADLSVLFGGGSPPERTYSYGGYSNSHFLRGSRWVYINDNGYGAPQLYDLEADPEEVVNVAADNPDVVEQMRATVEARAGGALESYG